MVPLGEIATPVQRIVPVVPGDAYRTLGVKWWGEGAYERQTIDGSQTAVSTLNSVRENDLIINKIWVRHGSVAVVSPDVAGCVGSNEFPTFEFRLDRVLPRWLHWYSKTKELWNKCDLLSQGSSGKNRIRPEKFLTIEVPLPPLAEQRRLVESIDALAVKIEEAKRLRSIVEEMEFPALNDWIKRRVFQGDFTKPDADDPPTAKRVDAILKLPHESNGDSECRGNFDSIASKEKAHAIPQSWTWERLGDLCDIITDGTHLTPTYVEEGRPFLSAQNVKPFRFIPQNHRKVSEEDYGGYVARVKAEKGDILMTRVGAMIGEAAIIDQDIDFAFYVSLCLIKPMKGKLFVPYLLHWLNSPYGAASARDKTLGKGHSQGNLNLNLIRRFVVPVPPLRTQQRIVDYLEALRAREDSAAMMRKAISQELNAMLPAILDRAFKGEL
jgi:type I restriction enzyme S subunit